MRISDYLFGIPIAVRTSLESEACAGRIRDVIGKPHQLWAHGVQGWLFGRRLKLWYRRELLLRHGQPVLSARLLDTERGVVIRGKFGAPVLNSLMMLGLLMIVPAFMVLAHRWIALLLLFPILLLVVLIGIKLASEKSDQDLRLILGLVIHATDGEPASSRTAQSLTVDTRLLD